MEATRAHLQRVTLTFNRLVWQPSRVVVRRVWPYNRFLWLVLGPLLALPVYLHPMKYDSYVVDVDVDVVAAAAIATAPHTDYGGVLVAPVVWRVFASSCRCIGC
jgi:hypothetical protein